jgi:hypothetical protein
MTLTIVMGIESETANNSDPSSRTQERERGKMTWTPVV